MTSEQETIRCEDCGHPYSIEAPACPHCNTPNPVLIEEFEWEEEEEDFEATTRPRPWWRRPPGCLSIIIFFLLIIGGIVLGGYDGLQEKTIRKQLEVNQHYQNAQTYIKNNQLDLAIAELNQTLALNPAHSEARDLLRRLQVSKTETPTPTSASRQNLAATLFEEAKSLMLQGNWEEAVTILHQIKDVNPNYEPTLVSGALFNANSELGLRYIAENDLPAALHAFDAALEERPNDPATTAEWEKVSLYLSVDENDTNSYEDNIIILTRLYGIDPTFADVPRRLYDLYKNYGDYLANRDEWCQAQPRYQSAADLFPGAEIETLADDAAFRCRNSRQTKPATPTPTSPPLSQTIETTATTEAIGAMPALTPTTIISGSGAIYFARFNNSNQLWEVIAVSIPAGPERVLFSGGSQPAVSANGKLLAYHSENADAVGLHVFNLTNGEDVAATKFAEDVLPRWGASDASFVFASQRSGDRRWQIFTGFADGKGEAVIVRDGRTPTLSARNNSIAYQGADPQGNNPGLYLISAENNGEPLQLTTDSSDRTPAVSPDGAAIAFMSAQNGTWDIWTVSSRGADASVLVATPGNDGLPVWSPDSRYVAFVSDFEGSWGIYVVTAQGGGSPVKVADWGDSHPDWLIQQISWGK